MTKSEVFISYAWDGDESEQIAHRIYQLLQLNNYNAVKDNKDLHYKGNIQDFEARIGRGSYIITIISDKYLKSEHCMNEMICIKNHEDVYDRIFPVVLKNADIYTRSGRLGYLKHWNNEIQTFKKELSKLGITGGAEHSMKDLTRLEHIKLIIGSITDLLSQMLTLTPEKHQQTNFSGLLGALEKQAAKDALENQRLGNNQNDGEPVETDEHISLLSGEDQKVDEKQALLRILHVSDLNFTCPGN
ncbi:MAG: toll/interleukin-1 receptor domain-containing protein [Spirochaetales bacterium]|nr:toll/interleukin-1 receptor domain-containing protein [Spirochaetales bacterium]